MGRGRSWLYARTMHLESDVQVVYKTKTRNFSNQFFLFVKNRNFSGKITLFLKESSKFLKEKKLLFCHYFLCHPTAPPPEMPVGGPSFFLGGGGLYID